MSRIFHKKHNALRGRYKCKNCSRGFMMEWALKNHIKHCGGEKKIELEDY
jgi:hypothetical protein